MSRVVAEPTSAYSGPWAILRKFPFLQKILPTTMTQPTNFSGGRSILLGHLADEYLAISSKLYAGLLYEIIQIQLENARCDFDSAIFVCLYKLWTVFVTKLKLYMLQSESPSGTRAKLHTVAARNKQSRSKGPRTTGRGYPWWKGPPNRTEDLFAAYRHTRAELTKNWFHTFPLSTLTYNIYLIRRRNASSHDQ